MSPGDGVGTVEVSGGPRRTVQSTGVKGLFLISESRSVTSGSGVVVMTPTLDLGTSSRPGKNQWTGHRS